MALTQKYHVLILAGSRPGGEPFVQDEGKSLKAFVNINNKPMLEYVLETILTWPQTQSVTLNIPEDAPTKKQAPALHTLLTNNANIQTIATMHTPCTSILNALNVLQEKLQKNEPVLIVTADAPLLSHSILNEFIAQNNTQNTDFLAGIANVDIVENAYPGVKRTRVKFRDAHIGGCNLFALNNMQAIGTIAFWKTLENNRKKPWRLASSVKMMVLYLMGRLTQKTALKELGKKTNCRLSFAHLTDAHAAIDVDKAADLELVRQIMSQEN